MVEDEFIKLFQNEDVDVTTTDNRSVDKEAIQSAALSKIKIKEIAVMLQDLPWDDRYEWLLYQKNKANRLYYNKEYDRAIQIYNQMSSGLYFDESNKDQNEIMQNEFQLPIISNMALCYRKKKDSVRALKLYDMAIKMNPSPLQLLRRANYYFELDEVDKSYMDLKSVWPQCQDLHYSDAHQLLVKIQGRKKQQKQTYSKMFQKDDEDENENDEEEQEQEQENNISGPITSVGVLDYMYDKVKSIFLKVFGCKRIFVDEDDSEEEDNDPQVFLGK